MPSAKYNKTPIGLGLERLDLAIEALNTLYRETTDPFPPSAEIHMNDLFAHVSAIRASLTRAYRALEHLDLDEPAPIRKSVPSIPATQSEAGAN